jgi:hypothetical protein
MKEQKAVPSEPFEFDTLIVNDGVAGPVHEPSDRLRWHWLHGPSSEEQYADGSDLISTP